MNNQNITACINAMVAAAGEHGLTDAALARDLASNAMQAIEDDPAPSATLTAMINHRRFHWPKRWKDFYGSAADVARAMVRAYKATLRTLPPPRPRP